MTKTSRLRRGLALIGALAVLGLLLWPVTIHVDDGFGAVHIDAVHCGPAITAAFTYRPDITRRKPCQQQGRNRLLVGSIAAGGTAAIVWFLPPIVFGDESPTDDDRDSEPLRV